jgi:uncharacterized OsmC-like protein
MMGETDSNRSTTQVLPEGGGDRPLVRRKSLTAVNDGAMRTVIDFGDAGSFVTDEPVEQGGTNDGPTPLQAVVGALCGCESVTFHRAAEERGFAYRSIEFDAEFRIDIRGRMGHAGVRPHFQVVRVEAVVETDESEEDLASLVEETERRCPVFNLIRDADVRLEMRWRRKPVGGSGSGRDASDCGLAALENPSGWVQASRRP